MKYLALSAALTIAWALIGMVFFGTASIMTGVSNAANGVFGPLFAIWLLGCAIFGGSTVYFIYNLFSGW